MSVGKLMAGLTLLSLFVFGNAVADTRIPLSATGGVRDSAPQYMSSFADGLLFALTRYNHSLRPIDAETHTKAAVFAVNNLDNGEVVEWSNPNSGSAGIIKVVLTKPAQGGFCRLLYIQVEMKNNIRDYQEYGCKTIDSPYVKFYRHR
jgi:hypothetical protein